MRFDSSALLQFMRFNSHKYEAEACGKMLHEWLQPSKKYHPRNVHVDVIYWLARWAGHWGNPELVRVER